VSDILCYTPQETPSTQIASEGQLTDQSQDESLGISGTGTLGETSTWVGEFVLDSAKGMGALNPNNKIALALSGEDQGGDGSTNGTRTAADPAGDNPGKGEGKRK